MFASTIKNDISTEKTKQTQRYFSRLSIVFWGVVLALVVIAIGMRLYHLGLPFDRDGYDEGVYFSA